MNNKNVLVVGGSGYIGGALTDVIRFDPEYNITVYDAIIYESEYLKDIHFIYGDIRDREKLSEYIDCSDIIIWLAAIVGDGACEVNPSLSKEVNQDSVEWLVKTFPDKRIVFTSTCSVYGAQPGILDENSKLKPLSIYAATKLEAEKFLYDSNSLILRLGTVFGKGDNYSRIRFDLVVNTLVLRAAMDGKLTVFGGDQFRPLVHVKDIAKTICDNMNSNITGVYNIVSQNVRIIDLAYQVRNHFPDCKIEVTDMTFEDSRNYRASSEKAMKYLKFSPTYSIDDGINEIKTLLLEQRIKDPYSIRYSNHNYLKKYLS